MRYSIINSETGEKHGFIPKHHRLAKDGTLMVVNENELKKVNPDIEEAARILGGRVLQHGEVINELKKLKA